MERSESWGLSDVFLEDVPANESILTTHQTTGDFKQHTLVDRVHAYFEGCMLSSH